LISTDTACRLRAVSHATKGKLERKKERKKEKRKKEKRKRKLTVVEDFWW
jgi:hypothetical protein